MSKKMKRNNDWLCGTCGGSYNKGATKRNGATLIKCIFCDIWYHRKCVKVSDTALVFTCKLHNNDSDSE